MVAHRFVMVARNIDHAGAALGLLENAADHVVVAGRPMPSLAQLPSVDDVANKIKRLAIGRAQEINQNFRRAARRSEMHLADPDRPAVLPFPKLGRRQFVEPVGETAGNRRRNDGFGVERKRRLSGYFAPCNVRSDVVDQ